MWWLLRRSDFQRKQGAANKRAMKKRVESGEVPGILAYLKHRPVGWCSLAPRERYPVLERSRILQRVDDMPVWSVVCFFHARDVRRLGLGRKLLRAALDYARKKGAKLVEGYPVEPRKGKMPDAFAWTGFASTFRKEGFEEVARRSATRPILRYRIAAGPK
jgi:GNAT superfamily N-acetyltransferase